MTKQVTKQIPPDMPPYPKMTSWATKLIAYELDPKRARPVPERENDPSVPKYYKRTSNYMAEKFMFYLDIPGETIPDVPTVISYPWSARPRRGLNIEDDISLRI